MHWSREKRVENCGFYRMRNTQTTSFIIRGTCMFHLFKILPLCTYMHDSFADDEEYKHLVQPLSHVTCITG